MNLFTKAIEHRDEEEYAQALVCCQLYIKKEPENKRAKLFEAVLLSELGNNAKAFEILEKVKPNEDDNEKYSVMYYRELASVYKEVGAYDKAIFYFDKCIALSPNHTSGYILKGGCLAVAGRFEAAKAEHLKAITLDGNPEEAFYNLALINRAEGKLELALDYCKKAIEIDHDYEDALEFFDDLNSAIQLKNELSRMLKPTHHSL